MIVSRDVGYLSGGRSMLGHFARPDGAGPFPSVLVAHGANGWTTTSVAVMVDQDGVDRTRVAAIGFCFGAVVAMELAWTGADLKAVVGFHPGFRPPAERPGSRLQAKVLMCVSAEDPLVPPGTVERFGEEMTAAGVDWQVHLYSGVQHNFTHPDADQMGLPGLAYHPIVARRSWRSMLDLFAEMM